MFYHNLVVECLLKAHEVYHRLGEDGMQEVENPYVKAQKSLRLDMDSERVIIDHLAAIGSPIRVHSEEHGVWEVGADPTLTGVLDGLDGTSNAAKNLLGGRFGTMFGIFDGVNPRYDDYLACGVMMHATRELFIASKGQGAFVIKGDVSGIKTLPVWPWAIEPGFVKIYIDEAWETNRRVFSKKLADFKPECLGASCAYYVDVACGKAHAACECTRTGKPTLEPPIAYGLVKEAGGLMVGMDGKDIGQERVLEFGYGEQKHIPIIAAANRDFADQLLGILNK